MIDLDKFRDPAVAAKLVKRIEALCDGPAAFMEVCGTHTMAISQFGIRGLIPKSIKLLSGPGCPVCVTALSDIDRMIAIAEQKDVIFTTFGDMIRVPGSHSSLREAKSHGADVRILYSPLDALQIAVENPQKQVVFAGVGFETTSPTIIATVLDAKEKGIGNFSVYPAFKTVPHALKAILESGQTRIDGFLCPGHVSAIIGVHPYQFIPTQYQIPCVIAGFEPLDILESIVMLLEQIKAHKKDGSAFSVQTEYRRGVPDAGNPHALSMIDKVMMPCTAEWRAIGNIPETGLCFRDEYSSFDASKRFEVEVPPAIEPQGCICGQVMMGLNQPDECPMFGKKCTPESPVGPCMVSSEGACAAWYKYGTGN
ncbi:TPA: hydrogenase formation protein HypD [Candidatus Edwardsbacteria bacterium]|nr:hydrogenase formation protein HypD [Candidatus Edwardsbacteria bacterium]